MYPSAPEAISMKGRLRVGTRRGAADNTIVGEVGFWLWGESLDNDGKITGVRKAVCASPGLVIRRIIGVGVGFLELRVEVESEDLGKLSM